jgi:antitoxin component of RelBE/YafQ-DinJ toxin-antitoxin module
MARRGRTPVRGIRIDTETWQAAQRTADERNEDLPDVIRAFLKRYARTARTAKPDTEETT